MVDDHLVEVPPSPNMLVVRNNDAARHDRAVGTAIGDAGVSISSMAVGPSSEGDTALMVITTDAAAPRQVLTNLRQVDGILDLHRIRALSGLEGPVHPRDGGATGGAPGIGLVVTDLDGSLWDVAGPHPPLGPCCDRARQGEGGAACSRPPPGARRAPFPAMADNEVLLPAVLFDGSLGRDFLSGTDFVRHPSMHGRQSGFSPPSSTPGSSRASTSITRRRTSSSVSTPSTHPEHMAFNVERTRCCELVGAARSLPVFTFSVCGVERALLAPVLHAVGGFAQASITPTACSGPQPLGPALGVSQVDRRARLLRRPRPRPRGGAGRRGWGERSRAPRRCASIACVPEDGCQAALALATHRIGSATAGGWTAVDDLLG